MQHFLSTSLCLALASALAAAAPAQRQADSGLQKIQRTFSQADRDADGFLDPAEAKRATIPSAEFLAQDHDGDRKLSQDEFLVYYRGLLASAKLEIGADVDREAERIQAARRKAAEQAEQRRRAAERAEARAGAEDVDVEKRLARAEGSVRDAAGRGELSRSEAKQRKDQLVERARKALDQDAKPGQLSPSVADKLKRVEAALAAKVAAGQLTRAQADERMQVVRARAEAVSGRSRVVAERVVREANTSGEAVDVRKRFDRAQGAIGQASGAGDLSREEAKARQGKLIERARNAQRDLTPTERQKLDAELKRLDEALAAGKLNAAQHAQKKQALIERAQRAGRAGADPRGAGNGVPLTDEERVRQRVLRQKAEKDKARAEAARKKHLGELEKSADDILREEGIGAKNAEAKEKEHAELLKREKEKEQAAAREKQRQAEERRRQAEANKRAKEAKEEADREKRRKKREGDGTGNRPGNNPW